MKIYGDLDVSNTIYLRDSPGLPGQVITSAGEGANAYWGAGGGGGAGFGLVGEYVLTNKSADPYFDDYEGYWTPPEGTTHLSITVIGGGGSGGYPNTYISANTGKFVVSAAQGGGSGGVLNLELIDLDYITQQSNGSIRYVVGRGGANSTNVSTIVEGDAKGDGGRSKFGLANTTVSPLANTDNGNFYARGGQIGTVKIADYNTDLVGTPIYDVSIQPGLTDQDVKGDFVNPAAGESFGFFEFDDGGTPAWENDNITDNQKAAFTYTGTFGAGNLTFELQQGTENGYDFFTFYVDGVIATDSGTYSGTAINFSGNIHPWITLTVTLTAGEHTLKWEFSKDGSESGGSPLSDTVQIKNIQFPGIETTTIVGYDTSYINQGAYVISSNNFVTGNGGNTFVSIYSGNYNSRRDYEGARGRYGLIYVDPQTNPTHTGQNALGPEDEWLRSIIVKGGEGADTPLGHGEGGSEGSIHGISANTETNSLHGRKGKGYGSGGGGGALYLLASDHPANGLVSGAVEGGDGQPGAIIIRAYTSGTGSNIGNARNLDNLSDVSLGTPTTDQILKFDGTYWTNQTFNGIEYSDLSVGPEGAALGDGSISYDNTTGVFTYTPPVIPLSLSDLSNVSDLSGATSGQVLKYNGAEWTNQADDTGVTTLNGLTDVTLSSPTNGQVLKYNGSIWINDTDSGGVSGSGTTNQIAYWDSGSSITSDGALEWNGSQLRVLGEDKLYWSNTSHLHNTPSSSAPYNSVNWFNKYTTFEIQSGTTVSGSLRIITDYLETNITAGNAGATSTQALTSYGSYNKIDYTASSGRISEGIGYFSEIYNNSAGGQPLYGFTNFKGSTIINSDLKAYNNQLEDVISSNMYQEYNFGGNYTGDTFGKIGDAITYYARINVPAQAKNALNNGSNQTVNYYGRIDVTSGATVKNATIFKGAYVGSGTVTNLYGFDLQSPTVGSGALTSIHDGDIRPHTTLFGDLGTSSHYWGALYVDNVFATGEISANGSVGTAGQVLTSAGAGDNAFWKTPSAATGSSITDGTSTLDFDGSNNLQLNSHFIPTANVTYDLGTADLSWRDLYLSGSTIYLGGATITASGNSIILPANTSIGNYITANGSVGTAGQVLTSGGPGANAFWSTVTSSGGGGGGDPRVTVMDSKSASITLSVSGEASIGSIFNTANTNSWSDWDTVNDRYQPQIAGWYNVTFWSRVVPAANEAYRLISLYKNGVDLISYQTENRTATTSGSFIQVSGLVYLNGTTDYVEPFGYRGTVNMLYGDSGGFGAAFTGHLVTGGGGATVAVANTAYPAYRVTSGASDVNNVDITTSTAVTAFSTVDYDLNSNFNTTTQTFTAPYKGLYEFNVHTTFNNIGVTSGLIQAIYHINGNAERNSISYAIKLRVNSSTTNINNILSGSIKMQLNQNDTAQLKFETNASDSAITINADSYHEGILIQRFE